MANTFSMKLRRTNTLGLEPTPGSLKPGEPAVNLQSGKMWVGNAAGDDIVLIGVPVLTESPTPPTNVEKNHLWYNSATGQTFIYYENQDQLSIQWVEIAPGAGLPFPPTSGGGGGGVPPVITTYVAPGAIVWNKPANFVSGLIEMLGGGGAGGGRGNDSEGSIGGGSGGGAGAYGYKTFTDADTASTETLTIGAAGVPVSGAAGGSGGDTAFTLTNAATTLTTTGGSGGAVMTPGSSLVIADSTLGGVIAQPTFDYFAIGGLGLGATRLTTGGTTIVFGGDGGSTLLGSGGQGGKEGLRNGSDSFTPGGGGGGCGNEGGLGSNAGGTGGTGWARIWTWTSA